MPPLLLPSEKDRDIIMSCTREGCTVFLFLSLSVRVYVCARAFEGGVQERERERERERRAGQFHLHNMMQEAHHPWKNFSFLPPVCWRTSVGTVLCSLFPLYFSFCL